MNQFLFVARGKLQKADDRVGRSLTRKKRKKKKGKTEMRAIRLIFGSVIQLYRCARETNFPLFSGFLSASIPRREQFTGESAENAFAHRPKRHDMGRGKRNFHLPLGRSFSNNNVD